MSGSQSGGGASTTLANLQQRRNSLLMNLVNLLTAGIAIKPQMTVFTVAALPTTAATGTFYWASNGRKGGEGVGAGTGLPVYFNPATNQWYTFSGNIQVTS
jgi:hypothetical protein